VGQVARHEREQELSWGYLGLGEGEDLSDRRVWSKWGSEHNWVLGYWGIFGGGRGEEFKFKLNCKG